MKFLPRRYIFCALQIAIRACGDLSPSSRSATRWLCKWHRLLGWKRRVYWLRVSDSAKKSTQNLWGIDSAGNLLIVEVRTDRGEALRDPFKGLVSHFKNHGDRRCWSTRELRATWQEFVRTEPAVIDAPSAYEDKVEEAFVRRQAAGNPSPIMLVLLSAARYEFRLSDEGLKNLLFLETLAGSARVALRVINGRLGVRGIRINCWSPRPRTLSNRRWRRRLR